jgi:hypothetical protein
MTISDFILTMAISLFVLGTVSMMAGLFTLITKLIWGDLKVIAQQTTRLAQKGIAEDIAGLVGNASKLIDALNQLVKTAAGIGIFLFLIGMVLIGVAYFLALRLM